MSAVVWSQRRYLVLTVLALVGTAVSGCLDDADEVIDPGMTDVVCSAEGAIDAKITAGGITLEPESAVATLPVAICITNEDAEPHTLAAAAREPEQVPGWVPPMAGGGGHEHGGGGGGHDHGGGSDDGHAHGDAVPTDVFRRTIAPGETVQVLDLTYHGLLLVHDIDWPDLRATWEILPNVTVPYPVAAHEAHLAAPASGDTMAGSTGSATFPVTAPDLTRVEVTVQWDDAADDDALGAEANGADELEVRLVDPAGNVVAEHRAEKRTATVMLSFEAPTPAFPATVQAMGIEAAVGALSAERPADLSLVGEWKLEVEVLSAPGLVPDADGSTADVPVVGDGHQQWNALVTFVHGFATVGAFGTSPEPMVHAGPL